MLPGMVCQARMHMSYAHKKSKGHYIQENDCELSGLGKPAGADIPKQITS